MDGEEQREEEEGVWHVSQVICFGPDAGTCVDLAPAPSASDHDFIRVLGRGDSIFQTRGIDKRGRKKTQEVHPIGVQVIAPSSIAVYRVKSTNFVMKVSSTTHNRVRAADITTRNSFAVLTRCPLDQQGPIAHTVKPQHPIRSNQNMFSSPFSNITNQARCQAFLQKRSECCRPRRAAADFRR